MRGLVLIGGMGVVAAWLVSPANASGGGFLFCFAAEQGIKAAEQNVSLLAPGEGETVQLGSALTLSVAGGGGVLSGPTFLVASSPVLLATPDIDSGAGAEEAGAAGVFRFTSTKATAVARTIYWAASFTASLPEECKSSPIKYTTPVRSLTVAVPAPAPSPPIAATETSPPATLTIPPTQTRHPARCGVPKLKGDSLALARAVLRKAHCSLGRVHEPRHRTNRLRVTAQSVTAGRSLPAGSPVAITLGPPPAPSRRT